MKQCKGPCGEMLSLTQFYDHPTNSDGKQRVCKDCTKAAVREQRMKYQPETPQLANDRLQRHRDSMYQHARLCEAEQPIKVESRGLVFISDKENESGFRGISDQWLRGPNSKKQNFNWR